MHTTGSGQTKATKDRVTIYQREGNIHPKPRGAAGELNEGGGRHNAKRNHATCQKPKNNTSAKRPKITSDSKDINFEVQAPEIPNNPPSSTTLFHTVSSSVRYIHNSQSSTAEV